MKKINNANDTANEVKKNPNEAQISRLKMNINNKKKKKLSLNMGSNSELVRTIESVLGILLCESVSDSVVLIVTTSFAVIIGLLVFVWKRLSNWSSSSSVKPVEVPKFSSSNKDEDDEGLFFPLSPLLCLVAGWVFFFFFKP